MVLRGGNEVDELANLSLIGGLEKLFVSASAVDCDDSAYLVEELQEVSVDWVAAEVGLKEVVDGAFEHEGVVDGDRANALDAEPAWLAAAREALVHHVVRNEEVRLKLKWIG